MTVATIRTQLTTARSNGIISRAEVRALFTAARDGGVTDRQELAELKAILNTYGSRFTSAAKAEFARQLGLNSPAPVVTPPVTTPTPPVTTTPTTPITNRPTTPTTPSTPTVPAGAPKTVVYEATRKPWTCTYWPLAANNPTDAGSPTSNLWSKGGPLEKFDLLLKARNKPVGALNFEKTPMMNSLVHKPGGQYIPSNTLKEVDAETTTGVDLDGNGKVEANIKWDFLDARGNFGKDGKTEGTMSVGWWGSCDKVARAGILFAEPKKDVTIDGVTFTAMDIKGLLTVLADSQGGGSDFVGSRYNGEPDVVRLKSGKTLEGTIQSTVDWSAAGSKFQSGYQIAGAIPDEVKVKLADGTEQTVKKADIASIGREDKMENPIVFHKTIADWLKSGRPAVMDRDNGAHVWNYNFAKAEDTIYPATAKPSWAPATLAGYNGAPSGGTITYVERKVFLGDGTGGTENYRYWLEEKNGQLVNGGWAANSDSPDFLWRPQTDATFTGKNTRNPFVLPELVKELYEKSIA